MHEAALTWSWLNVLTKERHDALLEVFGTLEEALKHLNAELLKGLGCRQETIEKTLVRLEEFDVAAYANQLKKAGIRFLSLADASYPEKLREIGDPPPFLYFKGDLTILNQPCIAMVGTREMSATGQRVTELFVSALVRAGLTTVSGLALGIDAMVAKETLDAGGKTVAALGHGLSTIYPQSNAPLAEEILQKGGLLLSEFPLDATPDKYTFPSRNRIIAGLSLGTIVLEAPLQSGSIITAELALDYGRDVFAVPGPVFDTNYAGCNDLIAKGNAKLVSSADDVLRDLGVIAPKAEASKSLYAPQNKDEEALLTVLTTMPQRVDDLVARAKLQPGTVTATLTMLELAGAARNVGQGQWIRI